MNYRYEFIDNESNLDILKAEGFEDIPGMLHYFYNKIDIHGNVLNVHTIYINKETRLLTYRLNENDYEYIDLANIHEMIARKIMKLIYTKVIVPTSRRETKERYRK